MAPKIRALISAVQRSGSCASAVKLGDVRARRAALDDDVEDVAADDADDRDEAVEQDRDEHRGEHAGHDEALDRADAEHLHGVDLLADLARAEVGADRRAARAGDEQGRDDRAGLAQDREDARRAGVGLGAELAGQACRAGGR